MTAWVHFVDGNYLEIPEQAARQLEHALATNQAARWFTVEESRATRLINLRTVTYVVYGVVPS